MPACSADRRCAQDRPRAVPVRRLRDTRLLGATDVSLESRDTRLLFLPPTQLLRADPRFETLMEEIG